jgi:hypothetical protein
MLCMEDSMENDSHAIVQVVTIIMNHAPKGWTDGERYKWHKKICADTVGEKQLRSVVGVLYDGLAYGNWPWSPTTVTEILARCPRCNSDAWIPQAGCPDCHEGPTERLAPKGWNKV